MNILRLLTITLIVGLTLMLNPVTHAANTPVTVTPIAYKGWPSAYRLSNGIVEAIVVPQIGRIMAFHWVGQPETNPLWNSTSWDGKPLPSDPTSWANYGGDKVWPSPQSDWPQHMKPLGAWPPDRALDNGPYQATVIKNGLRLSGPPSPYFALRIEREITLLPGKAELVLNSKFFKNKDAQGDQNGFPVGLWSVTQTRGDETVFLPLALTGHFSGIGYTALGGDMVTAPNWSSSDQILTVTRDPEKSTKVGTDNMTGWIASLYSGDVLFSQHFQPESHETYPDKNTNAQVYTNAGDDAYIEMELLGPLANLKAGQTLTQHVTWRLERLPHAPADMTEARALIRAAMHP